MAKIDIRFSAAEISARIDALAGDIAERLPPDVLLVVRADLDGRSPGQFTVKTSSLSL